MAPLRPAAAVHASNSIVTAPPPEFRRHLFKTKLCRFAGMGKCRHGGDCPFAHSPSELEEQPDLTKTSICRDWLKGCCNSSNVECPFAHGEQELRETPFKKLGLAQTSLDSKALAICLQTELSTSDIREAYKPGRLNRARKPFSEGKRRASAGDHNEAFTLYQPNHGDNVGKSPGTLYPMGNNKHRFTALGEVSRHSYSTTFIPDSFGQFPSYTLSRRVGMQDGSAQPCITDVECQGMIMRPVCTADVTTMAPVGLEEQWLSTSAAPWTPSNVAGDDVEAMLRMAMPDHYED